MTRLAVLGLLAACTTTSPAPSTLQPQISVRWFEAQLHVDVGLQHDADVDVGATFRGNTVPASALGHGGYEALFELDHPPAADEPVMIEIDGITSTITAPPPFDDVRVPQFVSRSQPTPITWATTSPDQMQWLAGGSGCAFGAGSIAPNAGAVTLMPTDWSLPEGFDATSTCTVALQLTRTRAGTIDPALGGGTPDSSIRFEQAYGAYSASMP